MNTCHKCIIEYQKIYETEFYDIYECPNCKYQKAVQIDECCRTPLKIVLKDETKEIVRLLYQCISCGGVVNRNLPLSFKKHRDEIKDELNEYRYKEWEQNVYDDYLLAKEDIKENNFKYSKRGKYITYLNSLGWKA